MIWSAIVLGLVGSLHCMAMCGPILWTINSHKKQTGIDLLLYHGGRISTYMVLGAVAGALGMGVQWASGQQVLSIVVGIILIFGLAKSYRGMAVDRLLVWLKVNMGSLMVSRAHKQFLLGAMNGLLPCGLTYVALAAAVVGAHWLYGMLYMGIFGLGTLPMLSVLWASTTLVPFKWRSANYLLRTSTMLLAILLIVRGLGLGVPYLSPKVTLSSPQEITMCK